MVLAARKPNSDPRGRVSGAERYPDNTASAGSPVMSVCRVRGRPFSSALRQRMTAERRLFSVAWVSWVHDCFVDDPWAFKFSCEDAHPAVLVQLATGMSPHRFPAVGCRGFSLRVAPGFPKRSRRCPSQGRALARDARQRLDSPDLGRKGLGVREALGARTMQPGFFLLAPQRPLQPAKRIIARRLQTCFPFDLLPMHFDVGDEIGDFIHRGFCVHFQRVLRHSNATVAKMRPGVRCRLIRRAGTSPEVA